MFINKCAGGFFKHEDNNGTIFLKSKYGYQLLSFSGIFMENDDLSRLV